ncbi:MAG: hypothetical protein KY476_21300 [Planctomycetes bacterium]|nr:hypothetical protein [Planctomycetota bacterium]
MFYRLSTDGSRRDVALEGTFAGPVPSACWLIGGGPSLARLPVELVRSSPVPKMCVNLAGTRLVRPTFWTSYDPSARFHRSVYLDAGVMKFVHRRRAMDLIPETTHKVCDAPNLYFFDRDQDRGYADFLAPDAAGIVDWSDSLVQAIDILYRLGFRRVYLAGCELRVRPSAEQIARAASAGVRYDPAGLLQEFVDRCANDGLAAAELDELPPGRQYHFDEHKPLRAAANTDRHYFHIAQRLRLARRSLVLAGMQLVSVTPHGRLNDYFPYVPLRRVAEQVLRDVGDPSREAVRGLYGGNEPRPPRRPVGPMTDFPPRRGKHCGGAVDSPRRDELLVEVEGFESVAPWTNHRSTPR